ncbi:MAG TPA: metalloregulator ArsR/SmtB family transcription factor [Candidatus Udaeobacter sp.]|nr:metalloregulator ArsR/SmtB family transcription factor [Candidatus Udaeobacter sp.]
MLTEIEIKQLKKLVDWDEDKISPLFQALSDPNRCRILRTLIKTGKRDFSVSEIAQLLEVSIPTASEHLSILERSGALVRKRLKQQVSYEVKSGDPLIKSIISVIKANESLSKNQD